jgi:erythromycin esterase-like protein
VWAHNWHVGDARATELAGSGELSLGQLVRERHPGQCRLIGMTTYAGTVTAADDWDGPATRRWLRPALPGSVEELFHEVGEKGFLLAFDRLASDRLASELLRAPRLERAVGVVYRPETERQSHYLRARTAGQFDAIVHVDETRAVEPLERTPLWEEGEAAPAYPFSVG